MDTKKTALNLSINGTNIGLTNPNITSPRNINQTSRNVKLTNSNLNKNPQTISTFKYESTINNKSYQSKEELYNNANLEINKLTTTNTKVNITNEHKYLLDQIKFYADKIINFDGFNELNFNDVVQIKETIKNLENKNIIMDLNYKSLVDFNNSMTDIVNFFNSINKKINNNYKISDQKLLKELLLSLENIYFILNSIEKLKINVKVHNNIDINLTSYTINNILSSTYNKIDDINNKILKFINDLNCHNDIKNIIKFLKEDDIVLSIKQTLKELDENLAMFEKKTQKLNNSLLLLKEKIKCNQ
jgi:hypothetical protein